MKLAGVFPTMLAVAALAQSPTQYGTRIAQVQTAYLEDVSPATASALEISDRFREIVNAARSAGAPQLPVALVPVTKGPRAEFETWVEQLSRDYAESVVTGFTGVEREAGKTTIHRFVRDNFRRTELTYTMTLESIPGGGTFRVAFSDSTVPYPAPQILRDGETIALILSGDARTGRKMVDYIRAGTGLMKPRQTVARDVYAEDAELTITGPRLRINGVEQQATDLPDITSAPVVWVDFPGQGRYTLAFKPRGEGFEKAGEVSESSLVLSFGGNVFRIDCADRIATGSGTYNIYARRDSSAAPTRFMVGSGG